jgi:hypothetical protein
VLGLADYLRAKDEWLTDIGRFQRGHAAFGDLSRRLRVCEDCDGYLVLRKRWGHNYRFAVCNTYTKTGCTFTRGSRNYARLKSQIILELGRGHEPEHPFSIRDRAAPRKSHPARRGGFP